MTKKKLIIRASIFNKALCLKFDLKNTIFWKEITISENEAKDPPYVEKKIFSLIKPVFFLLPVTTLKIEPTAEAMEQYGKILQGCATALEQTNNALHQFHHLKNMADANENILFYNIDNNYRYKDFYETLSKKSNGTTKYLNMDSGFNATKRQWEETNLPMSLSEFVDYLCREKIKKIVSLNHFLLETFWAKTGVYLLALMKHMGIEYSIIDNDIYDTPPSGYLHKQLFHCNDFKRYSIGYFFQEYWDKTYDLKNTNAIILPQDYEINNYDIELNQDYAILVLSHSRLENVRQMINPILYLLSHLSEENIFLELQLWNLSLRHLILEIMALSEYEKNCYNSMLQNIFYTTMNFIKYEVIDMIDTERDIEIYGDVGWGVVFPEYYQKRYLQGDEIQTLMSEKRHLNLLLNHNITYIDASGPMFDAIKKNIPFINYSALVKTPELEDFKCIEYSNKTQLNKMIEDAPALIKSETFKNTLDNYVDILNSSTRFLVNSVIQDDNNKSENRFFKSRQAHDQLLRQQIIIYLNENEPFLRESFEVLLQRKPLKRALNLSATPFFQRKYTQRILSSLQDKR